MVHHCDGGRFLALLAVLVNHIWHISACNENTACRAKHLAEPRIFVMLDCDIPSQVPAM